MTTTHVPGAYAAADAMKAGLLARAPDGGAAVVLALLCMHANPWGLAWPSVASLVERLPMARSTVDEAVTRLMEAGLLDREVYNGSGGKRTLYRVLFDGVLPVSQETPVPKWLGKRTLPDHWSEVAMSGGPDMPMSGGPDMPMSGGPDMHKKNLEKNQTEQPGSNNADEEANAETVLTLVGQSADPGESLPDPSTPGWRRRTPLSKVCEYQAWAARQREVTGFDHQASEHVKVRVVLEAIRAWASAHDRVTHQREYLASWCVATQGDHGPSLARIVRKHEAPDLLLPTLLDSLGCSSPGGFIVNRLRGL